jgi:hypothetical protein
MLFSRIFNSAKISASSKIDPTQQPTVAFQNKKLQMNGKLHIDQ